MFQKCPICNGEGCKVCNRFGIIDDKTGLPPRLITHADHGQPIGNHITIRDIKEEVRLSSGIIQTGESANLDRYRKGEIVKVGTDISDVVHEGDIIVYDKNNSYTSSILGEMLTVIQIRDIIIVI